MLGLQSLNLKRMKNNNEKNKKNRKRRFLFKGEEEEILSFYRRRLNKGNIIPNRGDDEGETTYAQMLEKFCKWCNFKLTWREDLDNYYFCCHCGWEPVKKEKEEKAKAEKQVLANIYQIHRWVQLNKKKRLTKIRTMIYTAIL
jgi:hypothetical protein